MLKIKADLENVTNLEPATDDFEYFFQVRIQFQHLIALCWRLTPFQVKCTQCNETHPKLISINRHEEYDVSGGRGGTANFVWKCGICKREASAKFEPSVTKPYSAENGQLQPFLTLDCRNLEFTIFNPKVFRPLHKEGGPSQTESRTFPVVGRMEMRRR
jgi:hypothetical protein